MYNIAKILGFHVSSELDPGIYRSTREIEARGRVYPATQVGLVLAKDWRDLQAIENRGAYGKIGAGRTTIYVLVETAEGTTSIPLDEMPDISNLDLPVGTLKLSDWQEMEGDVWDGNNHVRYSPRRSRKLWVKLQFSRRSGLAALAGH